MLKTHTFRMFYSIAFGALLGLGCASASRRGPSDLPQHPIEVEVRGVRSDQGVLRIAVYDNRETFLREGGILHGVSVPPTTTRVELDVPDRRPVVVSVFHDLDGDAQLQRGAFGIPIEPWGFSGRPSLVGPPSWEACAIVPEPDAVVVIDLRGLP